MRVWAIGIAAASLACGTADAASLIHAYEFDQASASAIFDSVGGVDGVLQGGAIVAGGYLVLDGVNDYAQLDNLIIPAATSNFSVYMSFVGHLAQNYYAELVSQDGGSFYVGSDPSGNFRLSDWILSTGVPFPTDGLAHGLLVTADASVLGGQTKLYIDGTLAYTGSGIASSPSPGGIAYIGKQYSCCGEYFQGSIDAVRVFDGVATYAEASAAPGAVPEPASWAMMMLGFGLVGTALRRSRGFAASFT